MNEEDAFAKIYDSTDDYEWDDLLPEEREYFIKGVTLMGRKILQEIDKQTSYDDPKFVKGVVESVIKDLGIQLYQKKIFYTKEFEEVHNPPKIDESCTKIIVPIRIESSDNGIVIFTETQKYSVLPGSSAALYLQYFHHYGPCKVTINEDGVIYRAEKEIGEIVEVTE